jgi:glycosyltransferase involved in cell wall biosynthesis
MKIAYLHQYFNTPIMPGGTRSFEMARRLVAAGHEVELITSCREPSAGDDWYVTNEEGINVHWFPVAYSNNMGFRERLWAFLRFALASAKKAASIKSDVVFATSTPLTIVIPGLFAKIIQKIPLVFEVRDMWPAVPIALGVLRNPVLIFAAKWLEEIAYRHANHIIALAPGMRDDIMSKGILSSKITVIPNGCDLNIFGIDLAVYAAQLRKNHSWLDSRPLVLFAGTLGRANGVDYLVKVGKEMNEINPDVRFVIIGDGAERELIETEARIAGVLNKNLFLFHSMPKKELAVWLAASDFTVGLFSGPSVLWKDAVQNKFFDSIAAGKPMACNFSGFQSKVAVEHDLGLIIPSDNPRLAASLLLGKLMDTNWLKGVEERAMMLAKGIFNRDFLAKKLENVLMDTVGQNRNKHSKNLPPEKGKYLFNLIL